jgi:hypothetical protein
LPVLHFNPHDWVSDFVSPVTLVAAGLNGFALNAMPGDKLAVLHHFDVTG